VSGFRPDWEEMIQRRKTNAFGKGYRRGVEDEKARIIDQLLIDSLVITQIGTEVVQRIIEIVEDERN
jgi:hypothetical protein